MKKMVMGIEDDERKKGEENKRKRRTGKTRDHSSAVIFEHVVHKDEEDVTRCSQPVDGIHISHRANTAGGN